MSDQIQSPYHFLKKKSLKPRSPDLFGHLPGFALKETLEKVLPKEGAVWFDLETEGLDATNPSLGVVCLGVATSAGLACWDTRRWESSGGWQIFFSLLKERNLKLSAHNLVFDLSWLYRLAGETFPADSLACTLVYFRKLENRSFLTHRLEDAIKHVLGWPEEDFQKDWLKEHLKKHSLKKGEMSKLMELEPEGFQRYCALDAEASMQLYFELEEAAKPWDAVRVAVHGDWIASIEESIEQQFDGLRVLREDLTEYRREVALERERLRSEILSFPGLENWFDSWHKSKWAEQFPPRVSFKRKILGKAAEPHLKPWECFWEKVPEDKKSKTTLEKEFGGRFWVFESWTVSQGGAGEEPILFNPGNSHHVRDLIWGHLFKEHRIEWINEEKKVGSIFVCVEGRELEFPLTDKGGTPTDSETLQHLGPVGKLLADFKTLEVKERLCKAYLEASERTGFVHCAINQHGTMNGRSSSGQIGGEANKDAKTNLLNPPKDVRFMRTIVPHEDEVFLDYDFCLHPDTEVLTKSRGWVPVLELSEEDHVWQVNKDTLEGSWVIPQRIIKRSYKGTMHVFGNTRGLLKVTDNHKMLFVGQPGTKQANTRYVQMSQQGVDRTSFSIPIVTKSTCSGDTSVTEKDIWVACMIQADGSFNKKSTDSFQIQVAVERKKAKVEELLERPPTDTEYKLKSGKIARIWCGIKVDSRLLNTKKEFDLSLLGAAHVETFVEALSFWDSRIDPRDGNIYYGTTIRHNANEIQAYLVRHGYECKIMRAVNPRCSTGEFFTLRIKKKVAVRLRKCDYKTESFDGLVGCVTVPEGFFLVRNEGQTFVTGNCGLESVVAASFSKDQTLLELFGDPSVSHDVHLYMAQKIYPDLEVRERLAKAYRPDPEVISLLKKEEASVRKKTKTWYYALQYGSGARSLRLGSWKKAFILITQEQAKAICDAFKEAHSGLEAFRRALEQEWHDRGGFILNGFGRPLVLHKNGLKDLVSRHVQSTAHDCTLLLNYFIWLERKADPELRKNFRPRIVDFHDETLRATKFGWEERGEQVVFRALERLNDVLTNGGTNGHLPLELDGGIFKTLAEVKDLE